MAQLDITAYMTQIIYLIIGIGVIYKINVDRIIGRIEIIKGIREEMEKKKGGIKREEEGKEEIGIDITAESKKEGKREIGEIIRIIKEEIRRNKEGRRKKKEVKKVERKENKGEIKTKKRLKKKGKKIIRGVKAKKIGK